MLVGAMLHFSWLECLKREANDFSHDYGLHLWLFSPDHNAVMFMILINVSLVGGGSKGGPKTAKPHRKTYKNRNTALDFTKIPKPQLQMWSCPLIDT